MEEIWKEIEGYEGLYEVSNFGRVKSLKRDKNGKLMSLQKDKDGYPVVGLYFKGNLKLHKVHRLVAQTFLSNPDNLPQVNHKDEDKTNNMVDNLEWCTPGYNTNYGTRNIRVRNKELGKIVSEESRKKMSDSAKGKKKKPFTEEHKRHIGESHKGKHRIIINNNIRYI